MKTFVKPMAEAILKHQQYTRVLFQTGSYTMTAKEGVTKLMCSFRMTKLGTFGSIESKTLLSCMRRRLVAQWLERQSDILKAERSRVLTLSCTNFFIFSF